MTGFEPGSSGLGIDPTFNELSLCDCLFKWTKPGLFWFIFDLFNNNFTEKIVD